MSARASIASGLSSGSAAAPPFLATDAGSATREACPTSGLIGLFMAYPALSRLLSVQPTRPLDRPLSGRTRLSLIWINSRAGRGVRGLGDPPARPSRRGPHAPVS